MKAISIRQPWAWLILNAGKNIENRTWWTGYRGPVLIHASKACTRDEFVDAICFAHNQCGVPFFSLPTFEELQRGGIVGQVEVIDCVTQSDSPWFCGPHGFVLANPQSSKFQPCRGQLGFFTPELELGIQ